MMAPSGPWPATQTKRNADAGEETVMRVRYGLAYACAALVATGALCFAAAAQNGPRPSATPRPAGAGSLTDLMPRAWPEEVGLSSERLAAIGKMLNADIER